MNIYMAGVGGQGTGLLSTLLLEGLTRAGVPARGVDTHGLAQRGGVVVSQIRTGPGEYSPLITPGEADLVLALERHEALRAVNHFLREGGTAGWYDAVWQPYGVRSGSDAQVTPEDVRRACELRGARAFPVFRTDLTDPRMQNTALLAVVLAEELVPGLKREHLVSVMEEMLPPGALSANLEVLDNPN